jgi:hypothetical protein
MRREPSPLRIRLKPWRRFMVAEFVVEFLDKFEDVVYKTLNRMEAGFVDREPALRPSGFTSYDIRNSIDPEIREKLGTEASQALTDRALQRMERSGSVKSMTSHHGNVWRTTLVLDAMAALPKPYHLSDGD